MPPAVQAVIDDRALSKLRWRCRRGLLENDLLIERFFSTYGAVITPTQAEGLEVLMDLPDNDLLDLLLRRTEPIELDHAGALQVLGMLRKPQ